ncbi:hypothetical protein, partial [Bradyrhizobium sp. th.b2]
GAALPDVAIPSQVGFKLFDNDPKQTRRKWISDLPRQKLIMRDLNLLLSELAICHGAALRQTDAETAQLFH